MKIKDILYGVRGSGDIRIKGISDDSRLVKKGDAFFILERDNFDIFSVLAEVEKKAVVFVAEPVHRDRLAKVRIPVVFVSNIGKQFIRAIDRFYGFDKDYFTLIAVTGTNGKTTVATLIYYLFDKLGEKASLIGTVRHLIAGKAYKPDNTTPGYLILRQYFRQMKSRKVRFAVMEVSSHAIEQERIKGLEFNRCVFTNLSHDHLDYHKTMQRYFKAKKKLFTAAKKAVSVINRDDPYGRIIIRKVKNPLTYAIDLPADLRAENIVLTPKYTRFDLCYKGKVFKVKTRLLGRHNVSNIIAASGVMFSLGFSPAKVADCIRSFPGVQGRLQLVGNNVFVDYAHTPDALAKVITTLKEAGYAKVICVFGCGGMRDRSKRKQMGGIACRCAEFTFITSDNPRAEDPVKICRQIKSGFKKNNYTVVLDRRKAIDRAIKLAKKKEYTGSCVLVAGKGHEDYQIIGDKRLPFKDSKVIRGIINGN